MKLVLIAYNEAIDGEVMELLEKNLGECCYTKWTKVLGKGKTSGPHLLSHVWPKANNVLAVCVDDGQAQNIIEGVKGLRKHLGHEGVKAFVVPLEAIT
jgi:nitrogen regulatory protein PII